MIMIMIMMMTKIMTMTMKGGGEYKSETGSQGILLRDTTTSSYHHRHDGHVNHDHSADDHENDEDLQDDHIGVGFHFELLQFSCQHRSTTRGGAIASVSIVR